MIPLDSFHLCLTSTGREWVIAQISFSFAFGRDFVRFGSPPVPRIEPSVHSLRYHGFRGRHGTNTAHEIDTSRCECTEGSGYSQQRRKDILRGHIFIPFIDRRYVLCCDAGENSARALGFNAR